MDWMNYFDVSSSMLFEATADSEADSDFNKNMDRALLKEDLADDNDNDDDDDDDDDALSCSCDDNVDFKDFEQNSTVDNHVFDVIPEEEGLADDYRNSDDEDEDDDEGVVDQLWNGDHNKAKDLKVAGSRSPLMEDRERQRKKLKVCADSVKEFMNQRDDRLFWESCLAS